MVGGRLSPAMAKYVNTFVGKFPKAYDTVSSVYDPISTSKILEKLKLTEVYKDPSKMTIIDIFGPLNGTSLAINDLLKPANYIIVNDKIAMNKGWEGLKQDFPEETKNVQIYKKDGYKWSSFLQLDKDIDFKPQHQPDKPINDSLLIYGTHTTFLSGGYFIQFVKTIQHRNWYQRFGGNVRYLFWTTPSIAVKYMVGPGSRQRRAGCVTGEAVCDITLIAGTKGCKKELSELSCLDEMIEVPYPEYDESIKARHKDTDICLVDIKPKRNFDLGDVETWNYVVGKLMIKYTTPLQEALFLLGPGAGEHLETVLPEKLLRTVVNEMTVEDFTTVAKAYDEWPFKQDHGLTHIEFTMADML